MLKTPENKQYLIFGGTFVLANKLQAVGDKLVDGLSTKQWFLLRNIADLPLEPPPTITQIAREVDSSRQNVTKMLELMERDGYVIIQRSESDSRSRSVRITESGGKHLKKTAENAAGFFDRLFQGTDEASLAAAGKVFLKLIDNLQEMQQASDS